MALLTFAEAKVGLTPPFVPRNHMVHLLPRKKKETVLNKRVSLAE